MSKSTFQKIHDYVWETPLPKYQLNDSLFLQPKYLLIWRIFAFTVVFGNFCWLYIYHLLGGNNPDAAPFFSYLTIWGLILVWSFFLLAIINMVTYADKAPNSTHVAHIWKITHIVFELAASNEFLICLFFWSVLFPAFADYLRSSCPIYSEYWCAFDCYSFHLD